MASKSRDDDVLVLHKKEAARIAGLSSASLDRAIFSQKLKVKKYGSRTLILKSELQRFLESLPDQPPPTKRKPRG
jgi:putative heme iron utilization protein